MFVQSIQQRCPFGLSRPLRNREVAYSQSRASLLKVRFRLITEQQFRQAYTSALPPQHQITSEYEQDQPAGQASEDAQQYAREPVHTRTARIQSILNQTRPSSHSVMSRRWCLRVITQRGRLRGASVWD